MTTKICPNCNKEFPVRGFHFHEKRCKPPQPLHSLSIRKRFTSQEKMMTPMEFEKFLKKAGF